MAYVNVPEWKSEQVAEWLKGLDGVVLQYIRLFVEKNINGQQLLDLQVNDLEAIGVYKIGHQEVILEAVELLKNFYYDLDRENLQLLALRLSCLAHSLHNELWKNHINSSVVSTQVLADVANVVSAVKPLVCWLDRSPFCDQLSYVDRRNELLKLSLEMAWSGMRDRFVDKPIEYIRESCKKLAELADMLIQNVDDSLLLQPASLDLATLKKRPGEHLDFYIVPSFHGILQVGELKCNSAAHQSGKIEMGDEIVQINYQTVVGWEVKEVMSFLFEESSTEVLMTLKKRPRHSKVFGQIYIKPYRLPCKKQMSYSTKWHDLLSPSRPELLTVPPHFGTLRQPICKQVVTVMESQETKRVVPPSPTPSTASSISSRSSESELMAGPSSPNSVRLYLPKPRIPVQRRATITGASPVSKHAPLSLEQFWHELKLEREWRSNSDEKTSGKSNSEMQLKRSSQGPHYSLNWSARLCNQIDGPKTETSAATDKPDNENAGVDGFIPLKQRIDSLNRSIEQGLSAKKPKLLPKPILLNKTANTKPEPAPRSPLKIPISPKDSDVSPRRERGKLDKSYSTPSYDYSIESKEPLTFNMKLPEEKVKSAPDNIISDVDSVVDFKKSLELKSFVEAKAKRNVKQAHSTVEEEKTIMNEYLEIKSDEIESSSSVQSVPPTYVQETGDKVNRILDTINSSLLHNTDSEPEAYSSKDDGSPNLRMHANGTNNHVKSCVGVDETNFSIMSPKKDADLAKFEESASSQNVSNLVLPSERLIIHATINVPATFPRHKVELKKSNGPPEPPPRPVKISPVHSKGTKHSAVTKSASKSIPHKSPKTTRKKNVLLTKRRSVSVKELGICDHEGWLYHRSRKVSRGSPQWIKGWFIIKGTIFYGFNSREAGHARLMISLPGFTVSPAEEVKSRNFSFKVYHTGTTFYFAAESGEDLAAWVESFQRVTVSDEELSIDVSETDGEEEDEPQPNKKEKNGHESHGPHAAMKKLTGFLLLTTQDSAKGGEKKFNSLKKSSSRKSTTKDDQTEGNHVASLDRKYLKFLSGSGKQNLVPVRTSQFRSYRRVPPMENPPQNVQESAQSTELSRSDSMCSTVPVPSASPTRPPDMADYRLASLAKCNVNNQRTPETSQPGGYMTLESFMLSRQEEERRHQSQQPRVTNVLRVPQCHAPPPPTPIPSHSVVAVTGRENLPSSHPTSRSHFISQSSTTSISGKSWTDLHNNAKLTEATSLSDFRPKQLKKTTQYQPPPWEPPNYVQNEESRLQPAFEMILDRNFSNEGTNCSKARKSEEVSSSTPRFKNLFGSGTKAEGQKSNLIGSPRLRRGLFRDKKNQNHPSQTVEPVLESRNISFSSANAPVINIQPPEIGLPNAPDYPGLEYPPVFEPGTYSLSDVSTLLRNHRMRTLDGMDDPMSRQNENYFSLGNVGERYADQRIEDNDNNNGTIDDRDVNENSEIDDFLSYNNVQRPC